MNYLLSIFLSSVLIVCSAAHATDFEKIHEYGLLSSIAYEDGNHKKSLQSFGHKLIKQQVLPGVEVNYMLSTKDNVQFLTVRGTANLQNAIVDLDIKLIENTALGIVAHQGFAQAAQLIYNDVQPLLNPKLPVVTTGHSLGGAVAVLLAMTLQHEGFKLGQAITFGQPKVTNVTGAKAYSKMSLWRVVTPKDIVPLVPPLSPLQIKNLDIYWHMGQEIILLPESQFSILEGLKSMLRATEFTQVLPNEENLGAHQMQTYLTLIEAKRKHSEQVPFKSSFSLFGLMD